MEGWVTVGVHRFSLLWGDKTKPGRAPGRRAAALAAAARLHHHLAAFV